MSKKKPIMINVGEKIFVDPDGVYRSKVIKSGNGGVIKFFKKFIGREVIVIVEDKIVPQSYKEEYAELDDLLTQHRN